MASILAGERERGIAGVVRGLAMATAEASLNETKLATVIADPARAAALPMAPR